MRLKLSSLLAAVSLLCGPAFAAPALPDRADIRDSGFVYCVSGQVNTFNPQKVSSGLIVDTLAAQLYDRLLDVDPIPTGWSPSWRRAGKFSITAPPTAFTCAATSRFNARRGLPRRGTLMPMTSFLPLAVFLTATIRGTTSTAAASLLRQSAVC